VGARRRVCDVVQIICEAAQASFWCMHGVHGMCGVHTIAANRRVWAAVEWVSWRVQRVQGGVQRGAGRHAA